MNTMKIKLISFFLLCIMLSQSSMGQLIITGYELEKKILFTYDEFQKIGEFSYAMKNGKWVDLSDSNIVYAEEYYFKGIPVSTWKINFPNGKLRKEIAYDNDSTGNIIKWTRFNLETKKIIEIIPDSFIAPNIMALISCFEEKMYEYESKTYISVTSRRDDEFGINRALGTIMAENANAIDINSEIKNRLQSSKFQGKYLFFNDSGYISSKIIFNKGVIVCQNKYYFKKGRIKYEDIYDSTKLSKTTKYDKSGNIIKVKIK